jgi:hypothetical protein
MTRKDISEMLILFSIVFLIFGLGQWLFCFLLPNPEYALAAWGTVLVIAGLISFIFGLIIPWLSSKERRQTLIAKTKNIFRL